MVQLRRLVLWVVIAGLSGCADYNWLRSRRDEFLLESNKQDPVAGLNTSTRSIYGEQPAFGPPPMPLGGNSAIETNGPLELREALIIALRNSDIVRIAAGSDVVADRQTAYDVAIAEASIQAALADFDLNYNAEFYGSRIKQPPNAFFGPGLAQPTSRDESAFKTGFSKRLVSGGQASISYNPDPGYLFIPGSSSSSFNPRYVGEAEFVLRQPLLAGAGFDVNRAPVRITQIRTEQTAWDFKKAVMASVRSVASEYWKLYAARVAVESIDRIIPLVEEIVHLQEEAYKAQWAIYADVAKSRAQLHLYRQQRLELQSEVIASELRLRHLLGLPPIDGWQVGLNTAPLTSPVVVDPNEAVSQAFANDPDLVRQRLNIRIRELELKIAENGRLPKLDLQAVYRLNGVGEDLGTALSQLSTAEYSDWLVGATFSVPLGRRAGTAQVRAAELQVAREAAILQQSTLTSFYRINQDIRRINFSYRAYEEARRRLDESDEWLKGSKIRYENPAVGDLDGNLLLQNLNDYLAALRFRTDAATDVAEVLADYNVELLRLEESKGTLLAHFDIDFVRDPCRQVAHIPAVRFQPLPTDSGVFPSPASDGMPSIGSPAAELLPEILPADANPNAPRDVPLPNRELDEASAIPAWRPKRLPSIHPPEIKRLPANASALSKPEPTTRWIPA